MHDSTTTKVKRSIAVVFWAMSVVTVILTLILWPVKPLAAFFFAFQIAFIGMFFWE